LRRLPAPTEGTIACPLHDEIEVLSALEVVADRKVAIAAFRDDHVRIGAGGRAAEALHEQDPAPIVQLTGVVPPIIEGLPVQPRARSVREILQKRREPALEFLDLGIRWAEYTPSGRCTRWGTMTPMPPHFSTRASSVRSSSNAAATCTLGGTFFRALDGGDFSAGLAVDEHGIQVVPMAGQSWLDGRLEP
jgi:hypothetical protein